MTQQKYLGMSARLRIYYTLKYSAFGIEQAMVYMRIEIFVRAFILTNYYHALKYTVKYNMIYNIFKTTSGIFQYLNI